RARPASRAGRSSGARLRSATVASMTGPAALTSRAASRLLGAMAADDPPFADLRVLEWTGGLAGAAAGFLLAGFGADVATARAATGVQAMQWSWAGRPVWIVTPMISYMAGLLAALGVGAAVFARRRGTATGRVDVSGLAAGMALNSGTYVTGPETRGSLSQFGDPRGQIATYAVFPTADGWLFIGALTQAFLVKLLTVLDRVDLLADPLLQSNPLAF